MAKRHLAIIASSDTEVAEFSTFVFDEMVKRMPDVAFHVRGNVEGKPTSGVEELVQRLANIWEGNCYMHQPMPVVSPQTGVERTPRQLNYLRDITLVAHVDEVVAYFHPNRVMEGGTGHVVEAAIRMEKPCRAYTIRNGRLEEVGDWT